VPVCLVASSNQNQSAKATAATIRSIRRIEQHSIEQHTQPHRADQRMKKRRQRRQAGSRAPHPTSTHTQGGKPRHRSGAVHSQPARFRRLQGRGPPTHTPRSITTHGRTGGGGHPRAALTQPPQLTRLAAAEEQNKKPNGRRGASVGKSIVAATAENKRRSGGVRADGVTAAGVRRQGASGDAA
jgi:hypothetical protein